MEQPGLVMRGFKAYDCVMGNSGCINGGDIRR